MRSAEKIKSAKNARLRTPHMETTHDISVRARAAAVDSTARQQLCDGGSVGDACDALRACVAALVAPALVDPAQLELNAPLSEGASTSLGGLMPLRAASHLDVVCRYAANAALVRNCVTEARARHDVRERGAADALLAFLEWERGSGEGGSAWTT